MLKDGENGNRITQNFISKTLRIKQNNAFNSSI